MEGFVMYDYYDYGASASPVVTILYLLILAAGIVAVWKIFAKAGEPGWASLIPIYNTYVLFKITWGNGLKFLLLLIPIYNIVVIIQTMSKLAKAFGKSGGFALGLIFLSPVFMLLLAFGDAQYIGLPGMAGNAPYGQNYQSPNYYQPQQGYQQQGYQAPQQGYAPQQSYQPQQQSYAPPQSAHTQQTYQPEQTQTQRPAFCQNCGQPVDDGAAFCQNCGNRIG